MDLAMDMLSDVAPLLNHAGRGRIDRRGRLLHRGRIAVRRYILLADARERGARLLSLALPIPHRRVETALGEQLRVRAALDDHPLIEHDDLVRADDRGE